MKEIYEVNQEKEKAIIATFIKKGEDREVAFEHLKELRLLVETAGAEIADEIFQELINPNVATLFGKGKVEALKELIKENDAKMVVFDNELSSVQVRNLANELQVKVLDRSGIILDIFANNARTLEAQLQVELAQNQYLLTRLSRMWTHLSKQYGGIGTKGPGETQIETDRRIIRHRIIALKDKLKIIEVQNYEQRKSRGAFPRFALVGYTNAGKSTLMNAITNAGVYVENKLFATLSTIVRNFALPSGKKALISDTVGFIRKLPHHLVASFRSTLAEARESDIFLIVIDVSDKNFREQIQVVIDTLTDLNIQDKPIIYVFNKIDQLEYFEQIKQIELEYPNSVFISAERNINILQLLEKMENVFDKLNKSIKLFFPYTKMQMINKVYEISKIINRDDADDGIYLEVSCQKDMEEKLKKTYADFIVH